MMTRLKLALMVLGTCLIASTTQLLAAPALSSSTPANGATGVPTNTTVTFVFDSNMDVDVYLMSSYQIATITIPGNVEWSANVNGQLVSYDWTDDRTITCTYPRGFPAGALITWKLNPANAPMLIVDSGQAELPTTSGSFTTAGSSGTVTNKGGFYALTKTVGYSQTNAANVYPLAAPQAFLVEQVDSPSNNLMASTWLRLPGGTTNMLTRNPINTASFYGMTGYNTQAALDAAAPAGAYTYYFKFQDGSTLNATLTMPDTSAYPPIPKISNFDDAQSINAGSPFTFQWNALTGASGNDSIHLYIDDNQSIQIFAAPTDTYALPNTATSFTIPAGLLRPGTNYTGTLCFTRSFYMVSNSPVGFSGSGALTRTTAFNIKTASGAAAVKPNITGLSRLPNGLFSFTATAAVGRTLIIKSSSTLTGWSPLLTTNFPASGKVVFQDSTAGQGSRFYRIEIP